MLWVYNEKQKICIYSKLSVSYYIHLMFDCTTNIYYCLTMQTAYWETARRWKTKYKEFPFYLSLSGCIAPKLLFDCTNKTANKTVSYINLVDTNCKKSIYTENSTKHILNRWVFSMALGQLKPLLLREFQYNITFPKTSPLCIKGQTKRWISPSGINRIRKLFCFHVPGKRKYTPL